MGDGDRDIAFAEALRKSVVTQVLPVGATMTTYWVPERPGRWISHCHTLAHIPLTADRRYAARPWGPPADPINSF